MGILNGHARPIAGAILGKFADHTNVTCTGVLGKLWVCMGIPPAGPIICSAQGSTASADCFSMPAITPFGMNDTAGLFLGITGMCHQSSNRILFPANIIINGMCKGINASVAKFGLYGIPTQVLKAMWAMQGRFKALILMNKLIRAGILIDWLTKLNTCVNIIGDIPPCVPPPGGVPPVTPASSALEEQYLAACISLYKSKPIWSEDDLYTESIVLTLTKGLTNTEREKLYLPIVTLVNRHLYEHSVLAADFLENEIDTITFANMLNKQCIHMQAKILKLLGTDQYKLAMNESPDEFYMLTEPEILVSAYGEVFKYQDI